MKTFIEVTLNVRMSLEESLELEKSLSGVDSPAVQALTETLRIQNTTASRLVASARTA